MLGLSCLTAMQLTRHADMVGRLRGEALEYRGTIFNVVLSQADSILVGRASDGTVTGVIRDVRAEGIAADAKGNLYAAEVSRRGWRKFVKKTG